MCRWFLTDPPLYHQVYLNHLSHVPVDGRFPLSCPCPTFYCLSPWWPIAARCCQKFCRTTWAVGLSWTLSRRVGFLMSCLSQVKPWRSAACQPVSSLGIIHRCRPSWMVSWCLQRWMHTPNSGRSLHCTGSNSSQLKTITEAIRPICLCRWNNSVRSSSTES